MWRGPGLAASCFHRAGFHCAGFDCAGFDCAGFHCGMVQQLRLHEEHHSCSSRNSCDGLGAAEQAVGSDSAAGVSTAELAAARTAALLLGVRKRAPLLTDQGNDLGVGGFAVVGLDLLARVHREEDVRRERLNRGARPAPPRSGARRKSRTRARSRTGSGPTAGHAGSPRLQTRFPWPARSILWQRTGLAPRLVNLAAKSSQSCSKECSLSIRICGRGGRVDGMATTVDQDWRRLTRAKLTSKSCD